MFRIGLEHPDQPDIVQLIADPDDCQKPPYPSESHLETPNLWRIVFDKRRAVCDCVP